MILSGRLRHRITVEIFTESQDEFGEPVKTWSADTDIGSNGKLWAAIEPQRGREVFDSEQEVADVDTLIRIRYDSGITPEHRVTWRNRVYDIEAVLNQQTRDHEIHLLCNEVNPGAS